MDIAGVCVNLAAVGLSAVAAFAIGMLWYMVLFGDLWRKELGITESKMKEMESSAPIAMGVSSIGYLVTATIMAILFGLLGVTEIPRALYIAFLIWLGFPAMISLMNSLYSGRSFTVYLIDIGYALAYLLAMAAILAWWR